VVESFQINVAITHGVTIHGCTSIKDDSLLERLSTTFVRERLFVQNYVAVILKSNNTTEGPEETRLNVQYSLRHLGVNTATVVLDIPMRNSWLPRILRLERRTSRSCNGVT